jgi:predicted transcriptional regulator
MENTTITLTAQIVATYVSHHTVAKSEIGDLMRVVYTELGKLEEVKSEPAVPIKQSIQPNFIVCLEDGVKLKMLRRHIKNKFNLTPDQYREKWGLSEDYPMVAPNYAKQRSKLAKESGLGVRKKIRKAA